MLVEILEKICAVDKVIHNGIRLIAPWIKYLIRIPLNPNRAETCGLRAYDVPPVAGNQPDTSCICGNPSSEISIDYRARFECMIKFLSNNFPSALSDLRSLGDCDGTLRYSFSAIPLNRAQSIID
jgi:hypothetical protein